MIKAATNLLETLSGQPPHQNFNTINFFYINLLNEDIDLVSMFVIKH